MAHWGPDGVALGFGKGAVLGLARLDISPEAVHEAPPGQDVSGGLLLTAAARLDNREELCDAFEIPRSERETTTDGALVRLACRRWGEAAPEHLLGDWAFASWDERTRTLVLSRDQLGNTALYYHYRPPLFAFSSDPQGLFALSSLERTIHEEKLASYLAIAPLAREEETPWREVLRLLPGNSLSVDPDRMLVRRYWEWTSSPSARGGRDEDHVEGFLERFRSAVTSRLRSHFPVGVSLSAGLDSGAVTALAAQALADRGKSLTAFTSVPLHPASHLVPGGLADEWPLARAVARRSGIAEHLAIDAAAVTPVAGIERAVAIHHAPQHAAVNEYWIMALHGAARERGIGVMLTGQLGNGGVSWSGGRDRILSLVASGRWDDGRKAMALWRQRHRRSWIGAVAHNLVKPVLRPYRELARRSSRWPSPPWSEVAAINPSFAERVRLGEALKASDPGWLSLRAIDPARERQLALFRNAAMAGPIWHATGAAFGMEVRDPTADVRLLEYCLNVPAEQDVFEGGERMLIRRAMEGLLPGEVQGNTLRGLQAADVAFRLRSHPEEMESTLARLERNALVASYLDLPLMRRVWHETRGKVTPSTSRRAATLLLRGIMCGCFVEDAGRKESP